MKEITNNFLIDTNLLVYAYDTTDEQKHKAARSLIEKCWKKRTKYVISSQNLAEFFMIATKKIPNPIKIEEAEQIVNDICSFSCWKIINYTESTLKKAIELYKKDKKSFWDSLIISTMLENGITNIYTENIKDFRDFEGITTINPLI